MNISLLHPRYWLLWVAIGLFWSLIQLPHAWRLAVGRQLGHLVYLFAKRRKHIALKNLKLCFPHLSYAEHQQLLYQHFESLGMGLLEMLSAWWLPDKRLKTLGHIEGLDHLQAALARGKGVILLSAHFTSLEIGTRFLTMHFPVHATYRPHENPLIEYFMKRSRELRAEKAIARDAVRDMLRSLKINKLLWFAVDQNYGHKNSVFAPFFGVPAATNTATARIAKMSGAAVVPFFTQRLPNNQGYRVILKPALENFPTQDTTQDAICVNYLIETQAKVAPEQYLWVHRRFKDRPNGDENFYSFAK